MKRERRLTKERDFRRVYREGRPWGHPLLVLRAVPNEGRRTRYGFAVGKRLGGAVQRNRVKRLLREAARLSSVREGWDVVVVARPPAAKTRFPEMRAALEVLLRRAQVLDQRG